MKFSRVMCFLIFGSSFAFAQGKVIHDKKGACQITVPADWKVPEDTTWIAQAPGDQGDVQLVSVPGKTVKPFSEASQKALSVSKMINNTPQSVFFANEPTKSARPITPYTAIAPGKGGTCNAMFSARAGVTEEMVKKMVATLSVAN
jgi:hypothetical protein